MRFRGSPPLPVQPAPTLRPSSLRRHITRQRRHWSCRCLSLPAAAWQLTNAIRHADEGDIKALAKWVGRDPLVASLMDSNEMLPLGYAAAADADTPVLCSRALTGSTGSSRDTRRRLRALHIRRTGGSRPDT